MNATESLTQQLLSQIEIKSFSTIDQIPADQWNALAPNQYPFILHEYLNALETHECVGEKYGWIPCHIGVFHQDQLIAALPLYEKYNNYGEFVFDQAWESAWKQVGLDYYPKLVSAMPYTPARGPRFLTTENHPHIDNAQQQMLLLNAIKSLCNEYQLSGAHILFADAKQQSWLESLPEENNLLFRHDTQFHWFNQDYETFDDFLAKLTSKKRKNIKQERRALKESGITFRILDGHTATKTDWANFSYFYDKTFIEKWSTPTLNKDFFIEVAQKLPDSIVLVLADLDDQCIAGALMFRSEDTLYGRHWGAIKDVKHLHFETCFYQGIEYAIQQGIKIFEPGAGGEHKIARGFIPVPIHSTHWLRVNPFEEGIDHFIEQEKAAVNGYMDECEDMSPYKVPVKNLS
ncbi:GNAT family N-acetyltransferase [Hydrogenovibrio kuenenii]|uniref:GNAT family N-acetyltransferase n=1 Tax=Hydrogenovibrio kuenenii TaxID=63658 RepID=UPI0004ADBFB6|nr:GNAT family N-acetyltransferase [Hydrogenovibrio kuenenii]